MAEQIITKKSWNGFLSPTALGRRIFLQNCKLIVYFTTILGINAATLIAEEQLFDKFWVLIPILCTYTDLGSRTFYWNAFALDL